jgi:hypothetical protein
LNEVDPGAIQAVGDEMAETVVDVLVPRDEGEVTVSLLNDEPIDDGAAVEDDVKARTVVDKVDIVLPVNVDWLCEVCEKLLEVEEVIPRPPVVVDMLEEETTLACMFVDKLDIVPGKVEVVTVVGLLWPAVLIRLGVVKADVRWTGNGATNVGFAALLESTRCMQALPAMSPTLTGVHPIGAGPKFAYKPLLQTSQVDMIFKSCAIQLR